MTDFYDQLNLIENFVDACNEEQYTPLPSDWFIIVTDVKDSTAALATGRFKDVNTLGAAAIALVEGFLQTLNFPFVFGGDGASMALSPRQFEQIASRLHVLGTIAQRNFNLELRIGVISVAEINERGASLSAAKLKIYADRTITLFSGGGLKLADQLIKAFPNRYQIQQIDNDDEINLNNLSCRWNAIPSKNGQIISIIIDAKKSSIYAEILTRINKICAGDVNTASPAGSPLTSYKGFWECLKDEYRLHKTPFSRLFKDRIKDIFIAVFLFKYRKFGDYEKTLNYHNKLTYHTDYKKFDDTLRLILDCSQAQIAAIEALLEDAYQQGHLFYGTHKSDSALMTCLVQTLSDGDHIHFIDGNNGGYTSAASLLKQQIKNAETTTIEE